MMQGTPPVDEGTAVVDRWAWHVAQVLRGAAIPICIAGVLAGLAGYGLSMTRMPMYKATALAVFADPSSTEGAGVLSQFQGLAALAGIGISGGGENAEFIATLRSRQFAEFFIRSSGLSERLCQLHCEDLLATPRDSEKIRLRGITAFDREVRRIEEDKMAGIVRISVIWPDRIEAAALANQMVSDVNELLRTRARVNAEASLKYLTAEIERTAQVDLRQALYRLLERQSARIMAANVNANYAFRLIDPAIPPEAGEPESPRRMIWAALGALLGASGALGVALLARRKVR